MAGSIVTLKARMKMAKARAGLKPLPKITMMAFGDGAQNEKGDIITPDTEDDKLKNELLRKKIKRFDEISAATVRYYCTLEKSELGGKKINEIALVDEDGDLVAIKTFSNKGKDDDMEMSFQIDDIF